MEQTDISSYTPPVDKLLTYGEANNAASKDWPDYRELGLGPEHIPDLIRMTTDDRLNGADSDSLEVWAPVHAWRTLGQLRAEAAIEPLITLFDDIKDNDWAMDEIPDVLGMIGPAALPALATYIAGMSSDEEASLSPIPAVEKIGTFWPEARSASIEVLMKQLEQFIDNTPEVNGFLISSLVELKAREALPLIEQAFASHRVDTMIMGDWGDVQIEFGLKTPEEIEQERARRLPETPFPSPGEKPAPPQISSKERYQREATHKKAKSKMSSQSRKKNRRR